jgi:hypothetical protein
MPNGNGSDTLPYPGCMQPTNGAPATHSKTCAGRARIRTSTGKGRGLRATRDVTGGELLLLVPPLACLVGPPEAPPTPSDLVDAMLSSTAISASGSSPTAAAGPDGSGEAAGGSEGGPAASPWLGLLFDGSPASCKSRLDLAKPFGGASSSRGSDGSDGNGGGAVGSRSGGGKGGARVKVGGAGGAAKRERQALRKRVARVVAFNAFGDKCAGLGRGRARGCRPANAVEAVRQARFFATEFKVCLLCALCSGTQATAGPPAPPDHPIPPTPPSRHQDLALAALAREGGDPEEAPASCVGVWPEFALLNHSCVPNAMNYPLHLAGARYMVVRAARGIAAGGLARGPGVAGGEGEEHGEGCHVLARQFPVAGSCAHHKKRKVISRLHPVALRPAAGEEVTISYVGADQLLPLRPRRKALKDAFGFDCGCARCAAEEVLHEASGVGDVIEGVAEVTALGQAKGAQPWGEAAWVSRCCGNEGGGFFQTCLPHTNLRPHSCPMQPPHGPRGGRRAASWL